jgi:hypothetical protein
VNPFRDWLYQPADLPANTPVRLEMTVFGYSDSQYSIFVSDPARANNQLNVWLMRVCSN